MKLWRYSFAICLLSPLVAMALPSEPADMISWERVRGKPGGGFNGFTVWADGRSEIVVCRDGGAMEPKPGWTRTNERGRWYFRNANPLSTADAKKKFADARAAGIEELKTFANTRMNISRSPTRVRLQFNGKFRETTIPEFLTEGEQDNIGSENHRRFLAVEKINGDFDTNALDEESH